MGEQLRHMMRLLPHSVAVCTSLSPASHAPRGMTVSSFTSLSLDPALVTFHVATPSRTLDAIRQSGLLNFHVLAGDARGARAAHHFTGGNMCGATWSARGLRAAGLRVRGGCRDTNTTTAAAPNAADAADGQLVALWQGSAAEPPVLMGPGVMYVLRCRLFDEDPARGGVIMVRGHAVVVAEVVEIVEMSEKTDGHEQFGLVYADRHYRTLGRTLVKREGRAGGRHDVHLRKEEAGEDGEGRFEA